VPGATGSHDISANPLIMYKINDIENFVGRSLSELDRKTLLTNSWTPSSSYDFPVVHMGFQKRRFQMLWLEEFKWLAYSEIHEGAFCKWRVAFAPDVVSRCTKALGMMVKLAHKNGKKQKNTVNEKRVFFHDDLVDI